MFQCSNSFTGWDWAVKTYKVDHWHLRENLQVDNITDLLVKQFVVLWKESEVQIKTKFDGVVRPLPRGDNCKNNNSKNQIKKIEFVQTKFFLFR